MDKESKNDKTNQQKFSIQFTVNNTNIVQHGTYMEESFKVKWDSVHMALINQPNKQKKKQDLKSTSDIQETLPLPRGSRPKDLKLHQSRSTKGLNKSKKSPHRNTTFPKFEVISPVENTANAKLSLPYARSVGTAAGSENITKNSRGRRKNLSTACGFSKNPPLILPSSTEQSPNSPVFNDVTAAITNRNVTIPTMPVFYSAPSCGIMVRPNNFAFCQSVPTVLQFNAPIMDNNSTKSPSLPATTAIPQISPTLLTLSMPISPLTTTIFRTSPMTPGSSTSSKPPTPKLPVLSISPIPSTHTYPTSPKLRTPTQPPATPISPTIVTPISPTVLKPTIATVLSKPHTSSTTLKSPTPPTFAIRTRPSESPIPSNLSLSVPPTPLASSTIRTPPYPLVLPNHVTHPTSFKPQISPLSKRWNLNEGEEQENAIYNDYGEEEDDKADGSEDFFDDSYEEEEREKDWNESSHSQSFKISSQNDSKNFNGDNNCGLRIQQFNNQQPLLNTDSWSHIDDNLKYPSIDFEKMVSFAECEELYRIYRKHQLISWEEQMKAMNSVSSRYEDNSTSNVFLQDRESEAAGS